ncbi:MAG: hypothetical protein Q8K36_06435, partial [Alphaproteobacteria bacterium]|nr:hypothetical protein [Alphaproteobacteria bacterium]
EKISIDSNAKIGTLILPNSPALKEIKLLGTIATADLTNASAIENVITDWGTKIQTFILPNSPALREIELFGEIVTADLSKVKALESLSIEDFMNNIQTLILHESKRALGDAIEESIKGKIQYVGDS